MIFRVSFVLVVVRKNSLWRGGPFVWKNLQSCWCLEGGKHTSHILLLLCKS